MADQRISAARWRDRVAQWRSSGLPAKAYADQHGMPLERLNYWARRVDREGQSPALLPVRVHHDSVASGALELRSPAGWTMRVGAGTDPVWLAALLSGLR